MKPSEFCKLVDGIKLIELPIEALNTSFDIVFMRKLISD